MGQVVREQLRFFIISLGTGLFLRCIYDGFLLWRRICKHNFFWIGIEDALYWFFCCVVVFSIFYRENDGIIRGFVLVGVFGGMIIYHAGPSCYVVEGFYGVYQMLTIIISTIWKFVSKPFRWIIKKIVRMAKKIYKNILQKYKNCFTLKRRSKKLVKNKGKEQKDLTDGVKKQSKKNNSSKGKKLRTKRRKKATDFGNSVSHSSVCGDEDSFNFSKGKTRRKCN